MTALPSGTVTFLFTDVEGSTARWELDSAAMAAALARHNAILERAVAAHDGHVFHTVGDAYCAAFAHAANAIEAAVEAQRALALERWDEIAAGFEPMRVRMGIHTGLVELRDGDYFGRPVNRVARLMAAGHGGQVLVSLATHQLVRDALPRGCDLFDLGIHRLRDLDHSEHIYRLVAPGMPNVATPPRTAERLGQGDWVALDEPVPDAPCPYRGLHAFREADAPHFFGREAFTDLLVASVAVAPMVGVIGPSGSGKSSVVFAGLVPRLRRGGGGGGIGGSRWVVIEMRPGGRPYHALAAALLPLYERADLSATDRLAEINKLALHLREGTIAPADLFAQIGAQNPDLGGLLLVADQFEELYTLCPDDGEQRAFQDLLFAAAFESTGRADRAVPLTLALTLRADFMGHALAYRPFADAIQKHDVKLGPMTRDEIARAVRLPAEAHGRRFEHGLVERIVDDVGEKAGTLPLLEFALTKLWDEQRGGWLTHEAYERIERVEGAVARHADTVYAGLLEADRDRARRVFVQLVQPGEGTEDTRRLATRNELREDWDVARALADARLVTTGRDEAGHETAEVVHEALIRSWSRLRDWMSEDRRFRMWQERLRFNVRQWEASGRDEGALLRGVPLAEAEQWAAERGGEVAEGETALIRESVVSRDRRAAAESERQALRRRLEQRAQRLTRVVAALAIAGMVGGFGLAWYANAKRLQSDAAALDARRNALVARSQQLLADDRSDEALAVALEAVLLPGVTSDVELALSDAAYAPGARWEAQADEEAAYAVALSSDGRIVAAGGGDGAVRLFDAGDGGLIRALGTHATPLYDIAFAPDGNAVTVGYSTGSDDPSASTLEIWPVDGSGAPRRLPGHAATVDGVRYVPNSGEIVTAGNDGTVRLWDARAGREVRRLATFAEGVNCLDVDATGTLAVVGTTAGVVASIDLASGDVTPLANLGAPVNEVTISPAGRRAAATVAWPKSAVVVVDLAAPHAYRAVGQWSQTPLSLIYTSDGSHLLAGFNASLLAVIDAASGAQVGALVGHRAGVADIVVDRAGLNAYSVDHNGTLRAWSIHGAAIERRIQAFAEDNRVRALAFDPAGHLLAAGSYSGTVKILPVESDGVSVDRELVGHVPGSVIRRIAFSGDGTRIVSAADDATARVWSVKGGNALHVLSHGAAMVWSAMFIDDDLRVVTADYEGSLRVWDGTRGVEVRRTHPGRALKRDPRLYPDLQYVSGSPIRALSMASGGHAIAAGVSFRYGPDYNLVLVVDAGSGRVERILTGHDGVINQVRIESDGSTVTGVAYDRRMLRWPLTGGAAVAVEPESYDFPDQVFDLGADIGGRQLALGLGDGSVLIWDAARRASIRRYAARGAAGLSSVAMDPRGRRAARGLVDGRIDLLTVHPDLAGLLRWTLNHRLVRDLTCAERATLNVPGDCPVPGQDGSTPSRMRAAVAAAAAAAAGSDGPTHEDAGLPASEPPAASMPKSAGDPEPAPASGVSGATVVPTSSARASTAAPEHRFPALGNITYDVTILPDGEHVALAMGFPGQEEPRVETYRIADGERVATWQPQSGNILNWRVDAVQGGARLFSAGPDVTLRVLRWDEPADAGSSLEIGQWIYAIAPAASGDVVAYATESQVGVWESLASSASGAPSDAPTDPWRRHVITETRQAYPAVALHPDGRRVLAAKGDGSLWAVADWHDPAGLTEWLPPDFEWGRVIRSVAFSPDGRLAAAGGDAGVLNVWDAATGAVRRTTVVGENTIYAVELSPDNRHLAISDDSGVVKVYDAAAGDEPPVRLFPGHAATRVPIAFLPDGCRLLTADGPDVRVWDLGVCAP